MYDTAFQKNFAKKQQKCFHRRGIMSELLIEDHHSSDEEEVDQGGNQMTEKDAINRQLCMKSVDMYSVMHELDDIKAQRDEWFAIQQGYIMAHNNRGQSSQSFSLEKS